MRSHPSTPRRAITRRPERRAGRRVRRGLSTGRCAVRLGARSPGCRTSPGGLGGATPERTARHRPSWSRTRRHERAVQPACDGTGRHSPRVGFRVHTEVLMSSPDGQVSEMAKNGGCAAGGWCCSASPRPPQGLPHATPGARFGRIGRLWALWVRPGWRAVRASPGRGDAEQAPRGCGSTRERVRSAVDTRTAGECLTE